MQTQTFKLSLKPDDYPPNVPIVFANQYDVGRTFQATILDVDGSEYTFDDETVQVVGTKPDGTGFAYSATASGHAVTFETTGQMTVVAGFVRCGIIITDGDDVIGTLAFTMYVQPAALQTGTIISSDDFGSIIDAAVQEYLDEHGVNIQGILTDEAKAALLTLLSHVYFDDDDPTGQDYIDALSDELYNTTWAITNTLTHCSTSNAAASVTKGGAYSATISAAAGYTLTGATVSITMGGVDITSTAYSSGTISIASVTGALVITVTAAQAAVSSISAVYNQSGTVYDTATLDSLKTDLVVTATLEDTSTFTVPSADYTLSGTLTAGTTSTVTVTFGEKTDTFDVTVSASPTITWERGTIVRGEESSSTTRLRTTTYIDTGIKTISVTTAYKFLLSVFDESGTWVGHLWNDGTLTDVSAGLENWAQSYDLSTFHASYPTYKYRCLMRKNDNTATITTTAAENVSITY